jgi:hypothetical protein
MVKNEIVIILDSDLKISSQLFQISASNERRDMSDRNTSAYCSNCLNYIGSEERGEMKEELGIVERKLEYKDGTR